MALLRNKILLSSSAFHKSTLTSPSSPLPHLLPFLRCLSSLSKTLDPPPPPKPIHFMVDYLISTFGFSPERATNSAKYLASLKSPENPDAVIRFLKLHNLDDAHIRRIILADPRLLCYNVDKTLAPNMESLFALGFTCPDLPRLISRNPFALILPSITTRFQFWKDFFGNDLKDLRRAFNLNRGLICHDIATSIAPKMALLKKYGLSDRQIQRIVLLSCMITRSRDTIERLLNCTLETGFSPDSYMFVYGLYVLACIGKTAFESKMTLLKSYGWSEQDFLSAFHKAPSFARVSDNTIRTKMEFLVGRAGCTPAFVALHPLLLMFSLEKRLMPRHRILEILKEKGMTTGNLYNMVSLTENMFLERFILRNKENIPELEETYTLACAGKLPIDSCQEGGECCDGNR